MLFAYHPNILHKHWLQFLLGVKMAPRETDNNACAKFWGDKQRTLWYVMVFSGVVNCPFSCMMLEMYRMIQMHNCFLVRFFGNNAEISDTAINI